MLDDIESVDWPRLSHAYGPAEDLPGLLRGLAEGDEEALQNLFGSVWHQGTVYEATAFAVPFLIRILDAPDGDTAGVLGLLSVIAEGSSYMDVHQRFLPRSKRDTDEVRQQIATELSQVAASRTAVAAGIPTYLRLLATDPDEGVRAAAAHTISALDRTGTEDRVTPALRHSAIADDSDLVRASAVLALAARGEAVDDQIIDPAPLPRLAAAVSTEATRRPDGADRERVPDAVVEVIERDAPACFGLFQRLPLDPGDPLTWVVNALAPHWELQIRLLTAWMRHPDHEIREGAVAATEVPMLTWRPAAARLVPALAAALSDRSADVRRSVARQLAGAGRANAAVADQLWAAVGREPVRYGTPGAYALTALCRLHAPRADVFLADRLAAGPSTHTANLDLDGLHAAIHALGPWATACRATVVDSIGYAAPGNDRIGLILAAGRMAAPAADLVPVLRRQATSHPHATSRILGDLGPAAADALPELTALRTSVEAVVRVNAARAVWRITGDLDALLAVLRADLNQHHALQALAELGPAGAALADLLPPMFDDDNEWRAVCAATAYWHLTGDAAPVVPVLIRHIECVPRGMIAVQALADIGPAAAAAIPLLRQAVDSPYRQAQWPAADTAIVEDEAWSQACEQALTRIQGAPPPTRPDPRATTTT